MKLHLPNSLLVAVLAACVVNTTAWGGWASDANCDGYIYYYDQDNGNGATIETFTLPTADNGVFTGSFTDSQASDCYSKIYITAGYGGETKPADYTGQTTTIGKIVMADGVLLSIAANPWQGSWKKYTLLTIENLYIGDGTGTGKFAVTNAADNVVIESISGKLGVLDVSGKLTIGSSVDTAATAYTLETGTIAEGGLLTLAGGTTTIGTSSDQSFEATGELKVKTGAVLKFADSDVLSWGSNKVTLEGGVWDGGKTRQSVGASSVINLNGGTIKSAVDAEGNSTYGDGYAVLDFTGTGKIDSSGESSITGGVRIRNGNVTINVAESSALTIDTIVNCVSNGTTNTGGLVVTGEGTLKITSMAQNKNNEAFYSGSTSISDGATIEYAIGKISDTSTNDGSYFGTISGTGNIVKSGTGTVTLASVSNLDGDISVTGGTLNITSLTVNKTIDVTVTGGNLNITEIEIDSFLHQLDVKEGSSGSYYTLDGSATGKNDLKNGFVVSGGDYVLFNDYVWTGSVEGTTVSNDETNTYLSVLVDTSTEYYITSGSVDVNSAIGAEAYVVQGGTMNIEGTMYGSDIQYTSGSISLANKNSTLLLDSASNAASLLSLVTTKEGDAGTIKLTTNTTMSGAAQAKGKLIVEGASLKVELPRVDNADGSNKNVNSWLSSFTSIDLNNATVLYHGSTTTWQNVTVGTTGATLKIRDMDSNSNANDLSLAGTTTLNGDFTIESSWENNAQTWKYGVNIAALTGSGDLIIKGTTHGDSNGEQNRVRAKLLSTYTGTITAEQSSKNTSVTQVYLSADGNINLTGLNIKGGATVDLSGVTGTKNLGTVVLDGSSSLSLTGQLGNMAASGAGALTLAAGISTSGTVSIANALTIGGTIANTGSFTLSGNVTIADIHALKNNTIYSDNEGKDGYISSAIYYVVESSGSGSATASEGLLLNGTHTLTAENGNLVARVENETPGGIYYVNTRDFTVDGTDTNAAKYATGYKIAAGKTLTISAAQSDSMTAGKILSEATGEGNIELNTTASYSGGVSSQAEGKLTINKGVTLSVGSGSDDSSNISSFCSVDLKGGALSLNGASSEVKSLTVSEAKGTLTVKNANSGHRTYTLSGTTTLNADLDITSPDEHGDVIVKNLTGSKNLSIVGGNADWGGIMVRLEKLTAYTGSITVDNGGRAASPSGPKYTNIEFGTSGGDAAFSTLKGLEIKGNAYALVHAKANSTIDSLTLDNGSLKYKTNYGRYTYTLSNVVVKNTGTIAIESDNIESDNIESDNTYYEGEVTIANLRNAEGVTSSELTLSSNFKDTQANVFNLEDGNFSGKIVFESRSSVGDGTKRLHALNLKDGAVASKAVINVEDTNNSSHMGIAVGADKVIVKGIAGTAQNVAIYSGVQAFKATSFTSDGTNRTLEIATNGESYTSSAAIKENVNLVKSGEGTQTFTGTVASSSVSVLGGGLSLTGIETLQLQDLVVKSGATLSVGSNGSGVVMVDSPTAPASTTVSTPRTKLEGGATIEGSLNLSNASSLTLDGIGENSLVNITGNLILPVASETPTLTLSGDILSSLNAMNQGDELGIFSVRGGFFAGDQVTDALDATNVIALSTVFSAGEGYNFEDYYLGFYNIPDEAGYSTVYIGKIVPEPTTATLSLLALAALAARRRRR